MPLLLIEHLVVPFKPNGPKCNPPEKMPNFDQFADFVRDPLAKKRLFPIETIEVPGPNSAKFVHNEGGPPPSSPRLNAIPKLVFNRFTRIGKAKDALFGDASRRYAGSPFVNRDRLMPNRPNKGGLLATLERVPHL